MTKETKELLNIIASLPDSSVQENEQKITIDKINKAVNINELSAISNVDLRTAYFYINEVLPHMTRRARTFMRLISDIPAIPSHTATFI